MNNFTLDNHPELSYITTMMKDSSNHDARISCEETFTEDMGPADWANEPAEAKPLTFREAKMGGWSPEELAGMDLEDSWEADREV